MINVDARQMMADAKFYESYSRWLPEKSRKETWEEAVDRVMQMHREYYAQMMTPELEEMIAFAEGHYKKKHLLGSQRALQFGGEQVLKHQARLYNCSSAHASWTRFFDEAMYLLLCGCGVGFSVQKRHINQLPEIAMRDESNVVVFTPDDSIEGWAECFAALLSSYFVTDQAFPEMFGKRVVFDLKNIRSKGSPISGGFNAPGPDPLRRAIDKCELLLNQSVSEGSRLRPIHAYDFVMHMSDAVLAGGVRRSATICLFDFDDEEMMTAKTGNWFENNPQRGRSNNSAMILRGQITWEQFSKLMKSVEQFGEPGFDFVDDLDVTFNPCNEIGMMPLTAAGRPGFQFCNLVELNGGHCSNLPDFLDACKAGAILGTLQAGYTDFRYLGKETREITEREALLGTSITGWMNHPDFLFDADNLKMGADVCKSINKQVADIIGIRHSARLTTVKPSGNASVLLGTASGIHGEHSPRYLRNVQMNKDTPVAQIIKETNPAMVEESVWSSNKTDYVVAFPVSSPEGSVYKSDLYGIKQLEYVKRAQQTWIEYGTNVELCVKPNLRHNVSNTISVDNWKEVAEYVFANRQWFAGISFLGVNGDKDYAQAPFTEVLTVDQIVAKYGAASLFASGLLTQGIEAFGGLWKACSYTLMTKKDVFAALGEPSHENMVQYDFFRRARKFAKNYFGENVLMMTYCLKDVYNLHKWEKITRSIQPIAWGSAMNINSAVDVDTMGALACSGGACEITF